MENGFESEYHFEDSGSSTRHSMCNTAVSAADQALYPVALDWFDRGVLLSHDDAYFADDLGVLPKLSLIAFVFKRLASYFKTHNIPGPRHHVERMQYVVNKVGDDVVVLAIPSGQEKFAFKTVAANKRPSFVLFSLIIDLVRRYRYVDGAFIKRDQYPPDYNHVFNAIAYVLVHQKTHLYSGDPVSDYSWSEAPDYCMRRFCTAGSMMSPMASDCDGAIQEHPRQLMGSVPVTFFDRLDESCRAKIDVSASVGNVEARMINEFLKIGNDRFTHVYAYEWEYVPGHSGFGTGDLVLTDTKGGYLVVEVKHCRGGKRMQYVFQQATDYHDKFKKLMERNKYGVRAVYAGVYTDNGFSYIPGLSPVDY